MKKHFSIAIAMIALSTSAFAQPATASATANANIIAPIAIANIEDLYFGNIVASGVSGTVTVNPNGSISTLGGVFFVPSFFTPATFSVTGEGNAAYSITLPGVDHIISNVNDEEMTVNTFTSLPDSNGTLTAGQQTLSVGATLHVAAGQQQGTYTNPSGFNVTVNYN